MLKMIGMMALAVLMVTFYAQTSVSAQDIAEEYVTDEKIQEEDSLSRRNNARKLEGVWNLTVARLDCQTGAVLGSGPAILTFARGGTMHDYGSGRPPATRSAGYDGIWNYHRNRRYSDAFQFFIYNPDGTLAGRQIIREQIRLSHDGNTLTNTAASQILDVNGNLTANRCSSAVGTRFE